MSMDVQDVQIVYTVGCSTQVLANGRNRRVVPTRLECSMVDKLLNRAVRLIFRLISSDRYKWKALRYGVHFPCMVIRYNLMMLCALA